MTFNPTNLILNKPIEYKDGIEIYAPKIRDIIDDNGMFNTATTMFTLKTRELFVRQREVDALEQSFPTMFDLIKDSEMDETVGALFSGEKEPRALSDIIIDSLCYWTKLERDSVDEKGEPNGFFKTSKGKIIHVGKEWIIDTQEYERFSNYIKDIVGYKNPDDLAPPITSDNKHQAWLKLYDERMRKQKRKSITWADKVLMRSVETDSFIPFETILDMNIYVFNRMSKIVSDKEAYDVTLKQFTSGNFKMDSKSIIHWKERIKPDSFVDLAEMKEERDNEINKRKFN